MTDVFYSKLEGALRSLSESTYRKISLRGETVEFDGLNSPYVSHRSVKVDLGHGAPRLVIISNRSYAVAIVPRYEDIKFDGPHLRDAVPAFHFKSLFQFPAQAPAWITGLVDAVMLDPFDGFNDDGTPKWAKFAELKVSANDPDNGVEWSMMIDHFGTKTDE